jgi:single-stranded DNA-binding protein
MNEPLEPERRAPRPVVVDINTSTFTATVTSRGQLMRLPDGETAALRLRAVITGKPARPGARPKQIKVVVLYYGIRAEELCRDHVREGARIGVEGYLDYAEWSSATGTRSELRIVARFITVFDHAGGEPIEYEAAEPPEALATPAGAPSPPSAAAPPPPPAMPPPPARTDGIDPLTEEVMREYGLLPR